MQLLADLSALADRDGTTEAFAERYRALREQHHTKKVLQRLLDAAGL